MENCTDGCKNIIEGSKKLHDGLYIDCKETGRTVELASVPKFFRCKYFKGKLQSFSAENKMSKS